MGEREAALSLPFLSIRIVATLASWTCSIALTSIVCIFTGSPFQIICNTTSDSLAYLQYLLPQYFSGSRMSGATGQREIVIIGSPPV